MELRHLRYFLTLSEELHFRRAAEKLFIAQPALTRQIKDLEESLGVVLFQRDKRNVSLTCAGKFLQQEAYQLLKKVDQIKSSIADQGITVNGTVNIGAIGSAMVISVPKIIKQLEIEHPNVKTNIVENTTQNLVNFLLDGQIDIMFGRPHKQIENVYSEVVSVDTSVLVVAPNNQWGINIKSMGSELRGVPFVVFPRSAGSSFRDQFVTVCAKHDFFPIIKHETINIHSLLKLVENDIGVSILPMSIVREYAVNVECLELNEFKIPLDNVISYRTDVNSELISKVVGIIKLIS